MTQDRYQEQENGQEVETDDLNGICDMAGFADDRALSEMLRIRPYDGSVITKGILPYGFTPDAAPIDGMVTEGTTGGTVRVSPFRAFVGSRTAEASDATANWRDIRSADYIGAVDSLDHDVAITANASGSARIDLIYAAFAIDAPGEQGTRFVRDPSTEVQTPELVTLKIAQVVTIGVITGTPSATPVVPTTPSDSGSTFIIPIAYLAIPNGWGGSSTLAKTRILIVAPIVPISPTTGASSVTVANSLNKVGGSYLTAARMAAWANTGVRPNAFVPSTMIGKKTLIVDLDLQDASSANWSHQNGFVVDDSQDWGHRTAEWHAMLNLASANIKFAWDQALTSTNPAVPQAVVTAPGTYESSGMGQSFTRDANGSTGANSGFVMLLTSARISALASAVVGLYVDYADGNKLKLFVSGAPGARLHVILHMYSRYSNNA